MIVHSDPARDFFAHDRALLLLGLRAVRAESEHNKDVGVRDPGPVEGIYHGRQEEVGAGEAGDVVHQNCDRFAWLHHAGQRRGTGGVIQRKLNRRRFAPGGLGSGRFDDSGLQTQRKPALAVGNLKRLGPSYMPRISDIRRDAQRLFVFSAVLAMNVFS